MLPPHFPRRRLQRLMNFGALSRGFGTCCLRFKNDVATIPARLTSGWLARLCREGVDPLDRCKRFQVIHPPFLDLAWRKGSFIMLCFPEMLIRERAARAADVTSWNRSRCPCVATAIPGRRGQFRQMALPWMLGTRRAIFRAYTLRAAGTGGPLGRGPDCRFTGTGNRSEPALAGYQHFGGSFDEPLKPYRSYPADLTSGP